MEDKIVPIIPYFCRDGNVIVEEWSAIEQYSPSLIAEIKYIRYKDRKGKVSDPVVRQVIWRT